MANKFAIEAIFKGIDKMSGPVRKMGNSIAVFTRRSKARLKTLGKAIKGVGSTMLGIGKKAGAIGGVAAGALGFLIKKVADAGDNLAKFGRRVGFSVESLQEWRQVGELAGIEAQAFDDSLQGFSKRLGEAKVGTGSLVTFLKKFDKQLLKQLVSAKGNEEAFELLVNALRNTTDASKTSALAAAAFGRSGLKFVNIADSSAEAVKGQRKEMIKLGLISQKSAEDSEVFNDMLLRFTKSLSGVANIIGGALIPVLTPMIEKMTELVVGLRPEIEAFAKAFAADLPNKLMAVRDAFVQIGSVMRGLFTLGKSIATIFDATFGAVGRFLGSAAGAIVSSIQGSAANRNALIDQADAGVITRESRQTSTAELLIRDQTGRAEMTGSVAPGIDLQLEPSGA